MCLCVKKVMVQPFCAAVFMVMDVSIDDLEIQTKPALQLNNNNDSWIDG